MPRRDSEPDYELLGRVIRHEVKRYPGGKSAFIDEAKVSRAAIDKAIRGQTTFESDVLERIEHGLGHPDGSFHLIALGRLEPLPAMGMRPGLVQWITSGAHDPIGNGPGRNSEAV